MVKKKSGRFAQNLQIYRGESVNDSERRVWENCPSLVRIPQTARLLKLRIEKKTTWTPDFLLPNGHYLEVKGYPTEDWVEKMYLLKEQLPEEFAKVHVLFTNPKVRLPSRKKSLAVQWAYAIGLDYDVCFPEVPQRWLK